MWIRLSSNPSIQKKSLRGRSPMLSPPTSRSDGSNAQVSVLPKTVSLQSSCCWSGVGRGDAAGAGVEIAVAEALVVVLGVGWWRRSFVLLWMLCTRYVFVYLTHLLQNQPRSENPLCREARTVVHRCLPRLLWPWPYLSLVLNNITMRILTRMRIRKSNSSKKSNVMFLFVMWTLVVTSSAIVRRFDEGCYC